MSNHLPIYKQSYDLLTAVLKASKNFPVEYRFLIAGRLNDNCVDLICTIAKANSNTTNRLQNIDHILELLGSIEVLLRVSHDFKIIPTKVYAIAVELTHSIGRQAKGWFKANTTPE